MFQNLNWWEIGALLLLALLIFGDKLPHVIADGLRMLRNVQRMAQNATGDLNRELGTDIQLEDLHPKTFLRKHLLSEEDQEALTRPLKGLSEDLRRQTRAIGDEVKDVGRQARTVAEEVRGATGVRASDTPRAVPPTPRAGFEDVT